MIRRRLLALAALSVVPAVADAQSFGYLAFGDSITCGKYDTEDRDSYGPCKNGSVSPLHQTAGYPARLRQAGRLDCPVDGSGGCMVYNYGKPGEKTGAGLTRLDSILSQQNFDILLLMHGTNDVWNDISNNTIEANLQAMENKAKAKGVDTVFASIIHFHPQSPKASKNSQVQNLKNDLAAIAASRGRWFANPWQVLCPGSTCFSQHYHFGGVETVGLHPDKSGYDVLANAFDAAIKQAPIPATPSLVAPADGAVTDSSKVSWTKLGNATWYQVQWNGGGTNARWVDGKTVCNATTCSWTIPGLVTEMTHTWRVRARNPRGRSGWSATRNFALVASLPDHKLTWTPDSLGFGVVGVGESGVSKNATLENSGELTLSGLSFDLSGSDAFVASTGGCAGGSLAPGASCSITATFTPSTAGWSGARLVVASDQGITADIYLGGRGVEEGAGVKAVRLEVQPAGNGVFEPGEQVTVAPGWRNDEPAAANLQGTASNFGGPGDANYNAFRSSAVYGSVGPGEIGSCQGNDCYGMAVSVPSIRPAAHWDAGFDEEIPSSGAAKTWSLHIGDSFDDVPRSHLFYSAIEGVLHHGVTSGCSGTDPMFCPQGVVTRAQMAVFLLRAKLGGAYNPPPCTAPGPFDDVPCSHPFAAWIEDLVARGITAGCGGGNYCPSGPVTRSAMAVFLLRTSSGTAYDAPSCKGIFGDVACPSPFADWIEELYDRGIAAGCATGPLRYCPAQQVTRAQMASFLVNTFRLPAYGP